MCHITILNEYKLWQKWPLAVEPISATRLGQADCHRQSSDSSLRANTSQGQNPLHAPAVTPRPLVPSRGPPRPFCTLPAATRSFPCSQQEWAVIPFPKKAAGCSGWTAGLNQRGESHVNLKNIKMITSSRVTFLFIYRISQLCMTNFAQSHYLEQFV